jgi:hypothetical protein
MMAHTVYANLLIPASHLPRLDLERLVAVLALSRGSPALPGSQSTILAHDSRSQTPTARSSNLLAVNISPAHVDSIAGVSILLVVIVRGPLGSTLQPFRTRIIGSRSDLLETSTSHPLCGLRRRDSYWVRPESPPLFGRHSCSALLQRGSSS